MSDEQKQKMQEARKAKAAAAASGEAPAKPALPVYKLAASDKPEFVKLGRIRISRTTLVGSAQSVIDALVAQMKANGLNIVRVGGTLNVYGPK